MHTNSQSDAQARAWARYCRLQEERPALFAASDVLRVITDEQAVREFCRRTGRVIGVVYESRYSMMVVDLVEDGAGNRFAYERLVPAQTGGVVSLPMYDGKFVLLRQYRHAIRGEQLAFPRGFGEPGLTAEQNLHKELSEEIGAQVQSVMLLGTVAPDSGMMSTQAEVYFCTVSRPQCAEGHEGILRCVLLGAEELREKIAAGAVTDGFTLAALALWQAKFGG